MHTMGSTIQTLIRICLLMANPQDLPASREFLIGCVAAVFTVQFMGYNILGGDTNPLLLAAGNTALLGVCWIIVLQLGRRMDRWHQSACAIYGSAAIIDMVSLPIITSTIDLTNVETSGLNDTSKLVLIGIWAWGIAVTARIVSETLEIRLLRATGISIAMSFALQLAMSSMFGPAG
jgi:hypothetical protein